MVLVCVNDVNYEIYANMNLIIGAIAEELFFRCFLLKNVLLDRTKIKPVIAIILVSVLFAAMHLWNLWSGQPPYQTFIQMLFAFSFSIWAGAVTWKSTWLIPLVAHVLLNATAGEGNIWVSLAVSVLVIVDGLILMKEERL